MKDEEIKSKLLSTTELFSLYNTQLQTQKIKIGSLCSKILENPNERIGDFKTLFQIMNESNTETFSSVRKLVLVSMLEVFKDILPSYQIRKQELDGVKCKFHRDFIFSV